MTVFYNTLHGPIIAQLLGNNMAQLLSRVTLSP